MFEKITREDPADDREHSLRKDLRENLNNGWMRHYAVHAQTDRPSTWGNLMVGQ